MRRAIGIFYPRVALYLILKISNVYSLQLRTFILIPSSAALNTACVEATWRMPLRELAAVRRQRRRTERDFFISEKCHIFVLANIIHNYISESGFQNRNPATIVRRAFREQSR